MPGLMGDPLKGTYWGDLQNWNAMFHSGVVALVLAACGVFSRHRKEAVWWAVITLGLASYCLGGVVYTVCYLYVPGFNLFRRPIVLRLFLLFSVAVMAALGCDAVQGASRRRGGSRVMFVASGLGLAGLIYGVAGWIGQIEPPDWWLSLVLSLIHI